MKKERVFISQQLATAIKKARSEQKQSQMEIATELEVSPSVISKIEKGSCQDSKERVLQLCQILGIDYDTVSSEQESTTDQIDLVNKMQIIELEMDDNPKEALEELRKYEEQRKFEKGKHDPIIVYSEYLRGKYASKIQNWTDAQEHYELTIRKLEQFPELEQTNLATAAYSALGRIMNQLNHFQQALSYIDQGFDVFLPQGERSYLYYLLTFNKANVLEKLNRDAEALKIIEDIWEHKEYLHFADERLNMYQIRVEILNKQGRYEEAIPLALEGLDLARLDRNNDREFELLSSLGEAYAKKGNLPTAKLYYQTASKLEKKIRKKYLAITTYTQLGKIHLQQGEYDLAEETLLQAIQLGRTKKDDYRNCKALLALGECYYLQQRIKKALRTLEQAYELSQKLSLDELSHDVLLLLAEISFRSKLSGYEKYINLLLRALVKSRKEGGFEGMFLFDSDPPEE